MSARDRFSAARRGFERRARRAVPEPVKPALRRVLDLADPVTVRSFQRRERFSHPVPPRRLRARIGEPDVRRFVTHGAHVADALDQAARSAGSSLAEASAMLDFGCGCGRVLRPVLERRPAGAYTAGCDVDDEAIGWLARAYGNRADAVVNDFSPPLPFDDARFDLVYSVSIFTHLSRPSHESWLAEMARITQPGGLALLSIHGEHAYRGAREDRQSGIARDLAGRLAEHGPLDEEGFVFEPYERRTEARDLHGIDGDYGLTFQSHDQVRREWSGSFDVLEIRPRVINNWQDLVVLRRR